MVNDLKRGPDAKPKIKQRRRGNFSSYERSDKHDLSDKNKKNMSWNIALHIQDVLFGL